MSLAARWRPSAETLLLWAILLAATWLRLDGVGFGLPALNDPDEPLFMMTALEMLQRQSFDPGWFGHPGTITLYSLAAVIAGVGGAGVATGRFADVDAFAAAVYADPGVVFLPARVMIVLCGVLCVWLTWRLGRRLGGARVGLVAAALLAVNAVHIEYSQIIRTDVQASVFMLLGALAAVAIAEEGRRREYLFAGLCAGLACATKWPAVAILVTALGAWLYRTPRERSRRRLAMVGAACVITLFAVSPYLLIDHATVIANLSGEARPVHPGATGGGFFGNLGWYVAGPLLSSFGIGALVLAIAGLVWGSGKVRLWLYVVLPFVLMFFVMICFQSLRWERWVVPLLPFLSLAAARALCGLADMLPRGRLGGMALPVALLILLAPMVWEARIEATARRHDTRQIASAWLRAHALPGSSILVEHPAFDLLASPFKLRTAMGSAGCVDVGQLLSGQIRYSKVDRLRGGGAIVDIGHVDPARIETCRADYAVVINQVRYRSDPAAFRSELARYDRLLAGGATRLIVKPVRGQISGREVHIVELAPASR
ncbi:MAG: glycosyltransferase family 39 protein [Sphingopyxis sp.]|nr:glycosyltransferase family 39 protein [Sphingopyxis sp.]